MRKQMMVLGFGVLFSCVWAAFCSAQCTEELDSKQFECKYEDCHSYAYVDLPNGADGDIHYECHASAPCCGQLFTTCSQDDGDCSQVLRNPEIRAKIDKIASTSEVLVADCRGRYRLYSPQSVTLRGKDGPVLASDRILR